MVLFSAVLGIRLILIFLCDYISTVDSGRNHSLFADSILLCTFGIDLVTSLKEKMAWVPLILGSLTSILTPSPGY